MRDAELLLGDLGRVLRGVSEDERRAFVRALGEARAVFVTGAGRSGLVARMFAMRLAHLGLRAHVVGDATAVAAGSGDVLVAVSGSGRTESTLETVRRAVGHGVRVALVTGAVLSPLTQAAHVRVLLPPTMPTTGAPPTTDAAAPPDPHALLQPMRTLFEQATLLFCDLAVLDLMAARGATAGDLERRHANLE